MDGLRDRTKQFAVRVFHLIDHIPESAKGRVIQTQLAKAASSVAANYRAAQRSRSRAEFISKLSTTFEEVDESAFWLEFLADTGLMTLRKVSDLLREADEICAIVAASRQTSPNKRKTSREPLNCSLPAFSALSAFLPSAMYFLKRSIHREWNDLVQTRTKSLSTTL